MKILVDSSVWVDFFRRKNTENQLPFFLSEDLVAVNDLVLAEILPGLKIKKQNSIIELLKIIGKYNLSIDWDEIIDLQLNFVKNNNYYIGIPDLIIFQNARQNNLRLYSFDKDIIMLCNFLNYSCIK